MPTAHQRRALIIATSGIVALLLISTAAFLWRDYHLALDKAGQGALQHGQRLAKDLEQTLTVARAVISQVDAQLKPKPESASPPAATSQQGAYATLLASLPLPFELHAMGAKGDSIAIVGTLGQPPIGVHQHPHSLGKTLPQERWALGDMSPSWANKVIPLGWRAASNDLGVEAYGVDLSRASLTEWLDRERFADDDRVSLFWMNDDGSATLMARAPNVPADVGRRVRAPWVAAANRSVSGVLDQLSAIDDLPRRVAFQRLEGAASSMVVVSGVGTSMALAEWRANLPYFLGFALLFSAAMVYGAWRLDRTLRALTQSKQHFQLALDSGNVWDWDISSGTMRYSPSFLSDLGYPRVPDERMAEALFKAIVPEDLPGLKAALAAHLKDKAPYARLFRIKDAQGAIRWFDTKGQAFWDARGRAQYMAGVTIEITEQVNLEARQRETLQRLDVVANASPVLFWTSNLNGEVDWVNRRWLTFTGQTVGQALGRGWIASVHPDDTARREAFSEAIRKSRGALSIEYRLRDKDGDFRWVVEQCLPLLDATGEQKGFIGSCVDISELRQAEAAARQRGAMLEGVFEVLQDLLFVLDQDGRFIHFQGSSDDRLYVPPEVFLGKLLRETMPPHLSVMLHEHLQLAVRGTLQEFDYMLSLADGEHHFEARMALLPDSDHVMVVARDITDRDVLRQQQERLRQFMTLQAQLATNFINLPLAHLDQGIDDALAKIGAFTQTDRAYIFEYDFARNQTSNSHEWCAPAIHSELGSLQNISLDLLPNWVSAHNAREKVYIPDIASMAAGPLRDILARQGIRSLITLPMNSNDKCIGFVGLDSVHAHHEYDEEQIGLLRLFAQMLVNVYGRKAADTDLRLLASELEQRVQDRTAQLDVSVQRLSQANKELESFAYSVSHDLKAPLRSVEGFASLLMEEHREALNAEGRDYLGRIQAAALHMARLISDLLAYSRMADMDKQIAPVRLHPLVEEVIGGMRNELDALHAQVHVHMPADLTALANPQGLTMVLRNLIDNALKFSRPGEPPDISLTARRINNITRLCVKDQGQGFDMKYHDRIFALFQRLHRPDAIAGTGIGLAMVHKAVQRMNGRIWAESKPGQGAKFHIELPHA